MRRIIPIGFQTDYKTRIDKVIQTIDQRVTTYIGFNAEAPVEIPVAEAIKLLEMIEPTLIMEEAFDWQAAMASLYHLSQQHPDNTQRGKVLLWTADDRGVSRLAAPGSHTKYPPPDSAKIEGKIMTDHAINTPILFLLKQNGAAEKGWRGTPFYWPVIRAQLTAPTAVYTSEIQS